MNSFMKRREKSDISQKSERVKSASTKTYPTRTVARVKFNSFQKFEDFVFLKYTNT